MEKYETPALEIEEIEEDVILTSGCGDPDRGGSPGQSGIV